MSVLVDSSVWIDYFRSGAQSDGIDGLIDENLFLTNDLILAELIPSLRLKRQRSLIALLGTIPRVPVEIDWPLLVNMQVRCLRKGVNKIGIPDLIIAQQAIVNGLMLYTLDTHFRLLERLFPMRLYRPDLTERT